MKGPRLTTAAAVVALCATSAMAGEDGDRRAATDFNNLSVAESQSTRMSSAGGSADCVQGADLAHVWCAMRNAFDGVHGFNPQRSRMFQNAAKAAGVVFEDSQEK